MASSMTKISSVTVGSGGSSSISFTSILQTFTDLHLVISTRASAASDSIGLRFNSDTGSNYTYRYLLGNGTTASSGNGTTTSTLGGRQPESTFTANTFGSVSFYIPNYTGATYKSVSTDAVSENNATTAMAQLTASIWSNTAAITSITIIPGSGNFVEYSTATLYGVLKYAQTGTGSKAVGGTVTTSGGYTYHTFFSSGMFTPSAAITGAEVLVVAGGGGTSGSVDGGAGAGGLVYASSQSYSSGVGYSAIVGAGGAGGVPGSQRGSNGTNSSFASGTVAIGGGSGNGSLSSGSGGSGGGQGAPGPGTLGTGTSGQGNSGGATGAAYGGGGGGASAAGGTGGANSRGGDGGNGSSTYSAWGSATSTGQNSGGTYYYAGGGGGAAWNGVSANGIGGQGGLGGGGQGAGSNTTLPIPFARNGMPNTGGGAGGDNGYVYSGGSGIVIVRYTT